MDRDSIIEQCAAILDRRAKNEYDLYKECERVMAADGAVYSHAAASLLEAAREIRHLKLT